LNLTEKKRREKKKKEEKREERERERERGGRKREKKREERWLFNLYLVAGINAGQRYFKKFNGHYSVSYQNYSWMKKKLESTIA